MDSKIRQIEFRLLFFYLLPFHLASYLPPTFFPSFLFFKVETIRCFKCPKVTPVTFLIGSGTGGLTSSRLGNRNVGLDKNCDDDDGGGNSNISRGGGVMMTLMIIIINLMVRSMYDSLSSLVF